MTLDHLGELLVGLESLPLQACAPVVEEAPRPSLALVVPELAEGLLEQVGRVQAFVGRQEFPEVHATGCREVLPVRQQRVLLALDEASVPAREPRVLGLAHLVERLAEVAYDVELVEENRRLRCVRVRGIAKRLPHVHHRQANATALLVPELLVEHCHALLGSVLAAEPDRAPSNQVAHHNAVGVPLANRDLVDADGLGTRCSRLGQLRLHVLLFQRLDRIPVEVEFLGNILDRARAAAPPHVMRKALGIERVVGQEIEPLALHLAAASALHAPNLDLEIDARIAAGQIANLARAPVVPDPVRPTAAAAERFLSAVQG